MERAELKDAIRVPGFVDLQVNGFGGVDFSDPDVTPEAVREAFHGVLARGTAAFVPTVITSPLEVYRRNIPILIRMMDVEEFQGRVLGLHLEGPFISSVPGAVGAHDPAFVREPSPSLLHEILALGQGRISMLTVAAEVPGVERLVREARSRGIVVSLGHSLYWTDHLERLHEAGATALTHLGNGLPNLLPRHENPIWAGLADERFAVMVIADGHHLPIPVLKVMVRAAGASRLVVVSDASPVAGLPPGEYHVLGNRAILEPSGRLYNPDKQCLVGSTATMLECMNTLASLGVLTLAELLSVGIANPMKLIGRDLSGIRQDVGLWYRDGAFFQ